MASLKKAWWTWPRLSSAPEDVHRLLGVDPARAARVVLGDETGERLADDQADIQRQAGMGARDAARAIQDDDMLRVLQDDVAGARVGDDALQVGDMYILVDSHQLRGGFQRHDLAMISIGKGGLPRLLLLRPEQAEPPQDGNDAVDQRGEPVLACADADIQIGPARIDIAVQPVKERVSGDALSFAPEGAGGGADE